MKGRGIVPSRPYHASENYRYSALIHKAIAYVEVDVRRRDSVLSDPNRLVQWRSCWLFVGSTTLSDRLMRSCARQRLVAASSRRTEEKVASRRGSGRHWRRASRARALSLSLDLVSNRSKSSHKSVLPKKAADDMLEQAHSLLLHKLIDHVAKHSPHSIKALVCLANVRKPNVIQQDLLHDEDSHRLAEL